MNSKSQSSEVRVFMLVRLRMVPYCGFSTKETFSAISATRLAILAAMISKGETPFIALGNGGVFLAAAAVAVIGLPTDLFIFPPPTEAAFLTAGVGRLVIGALATDGMIKRGRYWVIEVWSTQ
jgi:hypothetical protein